MPPEGILQLGLYLSYFWNAGQVTLLEKLLASDQGMFMAAHPGSPVLSAPYPSSLRAPAGSGELVSRLFEGGWAQIKP